MENADAIGLQPFDLGHDANPQALLYQAGDGSLAVAVVCDLRGDAPGGKKPAEGTVHGIITAVADQRRGGKGLPVLV